MTPQKLIEAMVMIAEAAVDEHTNRNSDYGGVSMMRAKEDAIKLLQESDEETIMVLEHRINQLTEENHILRKRITELNDVNKTLKLRALT